MTDEELARVNAQLEHPEASDLDDHIGLPNIARRIHLLFSAAWGVSLQNTPTGTLAVMRLPERRSGAAGSCTEGKSE